MNGLSKCCLGLLSCAALSACEPPIPTLAKLSSPVLSAQRRLGGDLLVVLSYDTKRTPCGTVDFLRATFDGAAMSGSTRVDRRQRSVERKERSWRCSGAGGR